MNILAEMLALQTGLVLVVLLKMGEPNIYWQGADRCH